MHTPVLLQEVISGLAIKAGGKYIDATAGEGGHLIEIAKRGTKVLAVDRDDFQIAKLEQKIKNYPNVRLVRGNFSQLENIAKRFNFFPVDGILIDLGLSFDQIKSSGRGFSYQVPEDPLDMRLDKNSSVTASQIINSYSREELYELFSTYSEEINSLAISQAIVRARTLKKVELVSDLTKIIDKVIGRSRQNTYARIFQALRIAVNHEFSNLKSGLKNAVSLLDEDGRLAVIAFHSLEDRIVKRFIRERGLRQINKKTVRQSIRQKFARSAKLRIIQKS